MAINDTNIELYRKLQAVVGESGMYQGTDAPSFHNGRASMARDVMTFLSSEAESAIQVYNDSYVRQQVNRLMNDFLKVFVLVNKERIVGYDIKVNTSLCPRVSLGFNLTKYLGSAKGSTYSYSRNLLRKLLIKELGRYTISKVWGDVMVKVPTEHEWAESLERLKKRIEETLGEKESTLFSKAMKQHIKNIVIGSA